MSTQSELDRINMEIAMDDLDILADAAMQEEAARREYQNMLAMQEELDAADYQNWCSAIAALQQTEEPDETN